MDDDHRRKQAQRQRDHERMLGRICMVWATIDGVLDDLLEALLSCSKQQLAALTTSVPDPSQKCEIIKKLITIDSPGPAWRKWFIAMLNRVSGEIGPMRNRYIHDRWEVEPDKIVRREKRAKIAKVQAFSEDILLWDVEHATPLDELERFESKALLVMAMLAAAEQNLRYWQREGRPIEPNQLYIPASKPKARWLTPQEHAEALRLGQTPLHYVFD